MAEFYRKKKKIYKSGNTDAASGSGRLPGSPADA